MVQASSIFSQNKLTSFIILSLGAHLLLFFCLNVNIDTAISSPEKGVVRLTTVKPAVVEEEIVPVQTNAEAPLPVEPLPAEEIVKPAVAAAPLEPTRPPAPPESVIMNKMESLSPKPVRSVASSTAGGVTSIETSGPRSVQFSTAAAGAEIPKPVYPDIARRWGHEGIVVIEIVIGKDGKVEKADLLESSGYMELDEAAMQVVLTRWKFQAAGYEVKTVKEFEFKLRR